jgi:single-strand DNA-binding protein
VPYLNRVILMGHLTRDPELRYTPSGKAIASFGIATSRGTGDNKRTEFHNCSIWDVSDKIARAQWASKLSKGSLVYAEGRLQTSEWEDSNGDKRRKTEIVCDRLDFLREKGQSPSLDAVTDSRAEQIAKEFQLTDVDPSDIPF